MNGEEIEGARTLSDESIVYLQENLIVTDDVYKEENIIFDDVTPKWEKFCKEKLEFEVPDFDS